MLLNLTMQKINIHGVNQLIFQNIQLLHRILGDYDTVVRCLMVLENDLELHEWSQSLDLVEVNSGLSDQVEQSPLLDDAQRALSRIEKLF